MNAEAAGNELVEWLAALFAPLHRHEATLLSVLSGLTLAFEFPEYARALYLEADSAGDDPSATPEMIAIFREWIASHPIAQEAS